jgi:septum formation protein
VKVILASSSPRRQELLQQVGWDMEVRVAPFAEAKTVAELQKRVRQEALAKLPQGICTNTAQALQPFLSKGGQAGPVYLVAYNAAGKAMMVRCALDKIATDAGIPREMVAKGTSTPIVAADTLVVYRNSLLGKPQDKEAATQMLQKLSGKWHKVLTGMAVLYFDKLYVDVVTTRVHFRTLTNTQITQYVQSGEPLDKAGAYGIQGKAALFIDKIAGSYSNVVGMPLAALDELLCKAQGKK